MGADNGTDLKKILIFSGNNFSRKELVEYQKIMSNDSDIKKLIKSGSPVRNNRKKLIGIVARTLCSFLLFQIVIFMTYFLGQPGLNPERYFLNTINTVVYEKWIQIVIFVVIVLFNILFDHLKYQRPFEKRLKNTYRELFSVEGYETSFKKYFKNKNRPAVPSTLWTPYAGSVVDAQIVNTCGINPQRF